MKYRNLHTESLPEEVVRERSITQHINQMPLDEAQVALRSWLGSFRSGLIELPVFVTFPKNVHIGENVSINTNCTILSNETVTIGDNVHIGPNVVIATCSHPMDYEKRRTEGHAFPITIGNDVFIASGAVICKGVTIGDRSVIGANVVVKNDVPEDCIVKSNPNIITKILKR